MKNEEIKEILDKLKINETTGMCYLSIKLTNQIRIIITNLQQENEKLKYNARGQVNDYFKDKYTDEVLKNAELIKENETLKAKLEIGKTCGFCPYYGYKSRCKKAIEYLENLWSFPSGNFEVAINKEDSIDIDGNEYIDNLLNILNGSDEK